MATRTEIIITDDYTGEEIASGTAVTMPVVVGGRAYELDLSPASYEALMAALEPFIGSATPVKRAVQPHKVSGRSTNGTGDRALNRAVREWAKAAGKSVQDRGRVSGELVAEYRAAQSHTPAVRAAVEAVNPPGDGLDAMKIVELRKLAAERGWSSLTRSSKAAIVATLRGNPDGPPATAQKRTPKPAEKPVEATAAPDLSRYTPAQRRELNEQARRFAKLHKVDVAARGRVPGFIIAAYEANDPSLLPKG